MSDRAWWTRRILKRFAQSGRRYRPGRLTLTNVVMSTWAITTLIDALKVHRVDVDEMFLSGFVCPADMWRLFEEAIGPVREGLESRTVDPRGHASQDSSRRRRLVDPRDFVMRYFYFHHVQPADMPKVFLVDMLRRRRV